MPAQHQNPDALAVSTLRLRCAQGLTSQGGTGCCHRIDCVGLTHPAAVLTIRPIDLHDLDTFGLQRAGEAGAVAAGALHPNLRNPAEAASPSTGRNRAV